jgi:uncharacterized protein
MNLLLLRRNVHYFLFPSKPGTLVLLFLIFNFFMSNPVVHFEMPYQDAKRMADFYAKAFGWKPTMLGPEMGSYVTVQTSECDDKGFPLERGHINGGFYQKPQDPIGQVPSVVIAVADIHQAIKSVTDSGGKMLGEPMEIPGYGLHAGFLDTEGNRVSMMQPFMK